MEVPPGLQVACSITSAIDWANVPSPPEMNDISACCSTWLLLRIWRYTERPWLSVGQCLLMSFLPTSNKFELLELHELVTSLYTKCTVMYVSMNMVLLITSHKDRCNSTQYEEWIHGRDKLHWWRDWQHLSAQKDSLEQSKVHVGVCVIYYQRTGRSDETWRNFSYLQIF